ncbi:PhaM family polyhydroxyalkanoate granule multifunctional regulatory protein [Roseateles sp. L2-2]|uniref:PhaM family polyhydroxyalkanoate granule multifunctional regulatory protein n=1 Tax=Roseateles sp. L2-2 TaxID=3422597 RepID=UPI003D36EAC2
MADTDFSKFVPGFDFMQGLMKNAGAAIPGFGQWVAPTLDPEELDKRINELRTVQFWLENNARMLTATIQALEVQRMTLSTLHAMNVPMADLKDVLKTPPMPPMPSAPPGADASRGGATADATSRSSADAEPGTKPDAKAEAKPGDAAGPRPAGADPMQWWNALTQQFTQVASNAMKTAQTAAAASTTAPRPAAGSTAKAAPKAPARSAAKPAARKAAPARKTAAKRKAP